MTAIVVIACMGTVVVFIIIPGFINFRAALGIPWIIQTMSLTVWQKLKLHVLGLKTPIINTLAAIWTFILAEGSELQGFNWENIMTHQHAVWVATALWAAGIWTHFEGLNAAAATRPAAYPLPGALPAAQSDSSITGAAVD